MSSDSKCLRGATMDQKRPGGEMKTADSDEPTKSQLLPLSAKWRELPNKPYFLPGIVTVLAVLLLFHYVGHPGDGLHVTYPIRFRDVGVVSIPVTVPYYTVILGLLILSGTAFAVYRIVGKRAAWWLMPAVAAVTAVLVWSPVMDLLQTLTNFGTPDGVPGETEPFVTGLIKMFFQAGLPEELLKVIPAGVGVWVALKFTDRQSPLWALRITEPLDGILIGVASGLGFAFAETIFQYVPRTIIGNPAAIAKAYFQLVKQVGLDHAVIEIQRYMPGRGTSLELMIPRLMANICGHAAYAGLFGYYIGLAVMKPAHRVKLALTGLAVAAGTHAAWDAAAGSGSEILGAIVKIAIFGLFAAAIAKAREISPNRSHLLASQILDRFSRVHAPTEPLAQAAAAAVPAAPAKQAGAQTFSITWDDTSAMGAIEIGTARIPVAVGARLYERQAPGTKSSRGDGIVAEVNANPNDPDVLGLKNLSNQMWQVTMQGGERRDLAPGRSVRIARGMRIALGDLTAEVR
jgi:RsiW-degrading membrane proteinase PrsW (M82 family)